MTVLAELFHSWVRVDQLALAARVECRGGLVEQQDIRIEHDDRSQRHALFFAAGEAIRRTVAQMGDRHQLQRSLHPFAGLLPPATASAAVRRRPRRRRSALKNWTSGILEYQRRRDAGTGRRRPRLRSALASAPRRRNRIEPATGKHRASSNRSKVDLPRAIGAEQRHAFAGCDLRSDRSRNCRYAVRSRGDVAQFEDAALGFTVPPRLRALAAAMKCREPSISPRLPCEIRREGAECRRESRATAWRGKRRC